MQCRVHQNELEPQSQTESAIGMERGGGGGIGKEMGRRWRYWEGDGEEVEVLGRRWGGGGGIEERGGGGGIGRRGRYWEGEGRRWRYWGGGEVLWYIVAP